MNEQQATMDGCAWSHSRHRQVSIEKVENGYVANANYRVKKPADPGRHEEYWRNESRTFVFPTLSELMRYMNDYLTADAKELSDD